MATKTQTQTEMSEAELLCELNSPEAAEDEKIWQAKFDATPVDKLQRLAEKVRADINKAKSVRSTSQTDEITDDGRILGMLWKAAESST